MYSSEPVPTHFYYTSVIEKAWVICVKGYPADVMHRDMFSRISPGSELTGVLQAASFKKKKKEAVTSLTCISVV